MFYMYLYWHKCHILFVTFMCFWRLALNFCLWHFHTSWHKIKATIKVIKFKDQANWQSKHVRKRRLIYSNTTKTFNTSSELFTMNSLSVSSFPSLTKASSGASIIIILQNKIHNYNYNYNNVNTNFNYI